MNIISARAFGAIPSSLLSNPQTDIAAVENSSSENSFSENVAADISYDATRAVFNALQECRNHNAPVLQFERGTYHFWPDHATEKPLFIPNNDSGSKRITFPLFDFDDLTIDGQEAEFVFHGAVTPVVIDESRRIALRRFSIDWHHPLTLQGVVTRADSRTIEFQVPHEYSYRVENARLFIIGEAWEAPVEMFLELDAATLAPAYKSGDLCGAMWHSPLYFESIGERIVRLTAPITHLPSVGNVLVFTGDQRLNPGIFVRRSRDIEIENVRVFRAPAMALICERTENIALTHFDVMLKPQSTRAVSASADATHFVNCRGHLVIEHCLFENQLDDPVNVHGIYGVISERIDARTLVVTRSHHQQKGAILGGEGDRIAFIRSASLASLGEATLDRVLDVNADEVHFFFNDDLPDEVRAGDVIENLSWTPDVTIRGCTARHNRARGFLVSTPRRVLIEDNTISPGGAGLFISGDCSFWYESGGVRDITVRGNRFTGCNLGTWNRAAIEIAPQIQQPENQHTSFHRNITIENNRFATSETGILAALSVDGLVFRGNRIERTANFAPANTMKSVLELAHCRNIVVRDNELVGAVRGGALRLVGDTSGEIAEDQGFEIEKL